MFANDISNGYSRANLANLSTRAKLAIFGEFELSPKWPFSEICKTRQTHRHSPSRVARTRQYCRIWREWPLLIMITKRFEIEI
jgi:hypothetical protein